MIKFAQPLDAGKIGRILSEFSEITEWILHPHSLAENISFASKMIDLGWVKVFEDIEILGFIARNGNEINALYVAASARRRGVGKALLSDAKENSNELVLWTYAANYSAQQFYSREGFREVRRTDGSQTDEKIPDVCLIWKK